jgi:hypothetical protein
MLPEPPSDAVAVVENVTTPVLLLTDAILRRFPWPGSAPFDFVSTSTTRFG